MARIVHFRLKYQDFEILYPEGQDMPYLSYKYSKYEIIIQPCMAGFCISIFKKGEEIAIETLCTNMKEILPRDAYAKALAAAQDLFDKYI